MVARTKQSVKTREFFVTQTNQGQSYFDMPPTPFPTLLDSLMKRWMLLTGFSSWAVACIALAGVFYGVFLILALFDGTAIQISGTDHWATLLFPGMIIYLLLVAPLLRQLLHDTIKLFRQHSTPEQCYPAVLNTYALNRVHETVAVILGILLYGYFGPHLEFWNMPSVSVAWQIIIGKTLVGGLLGWHIYSWLTRTKRLANLYDDTIAITTETDMLVMLRPILQWNVGLGLFFFGLLGLKIVFLKLLFLGYFVVFSYLIIVFSQLLLLRKFISGYIIPYTKQYLEMPPVTNNTILDDLMKRWKGITNIHSWFNATLVISVAAYGVGIIISAWDDTLYKHESGFSWWNNLFYPALFAYFMMAPVIIRHLFNSSVNAFQEAVPMNNTRFQHMLNSVDQINRGHELISIALGVISYLVFLSVGITFDHTKYVYAAFIYDTVSGSIIFGLFGWQIYLGLIRSKQLGKLHHQFASVNILGQQISTEPIIRWNFGVTFVFIGGIVLSAIFIPNQINAGTMMIYGLLISTIVLIFVFNRVPTALLPWFRVFRILVIFVMVAGIGTVGFYYLEYDAQLNADKQLNPIDALYLTIITMTTIGYGDIAPLTSEGRAFTILLSLVAVGISTYAISALASFLVEGDLNELLWGRRMNKDISKLHNHIILCGGGRIGLQIAAEFYKTNTPFVIVEKNTKVLEDFLRLGDVLYVDGDATKDEVLMAAGLHRAKGLITTLSDDKDNAFVVLTARSLNLDPAFRIIARLSDEDNREKLKKVGATEIVSPQAIGGLRMASVMIRPSVVSFLDGMLRAEQLTGQTLRLEEITLDELEVPGLIGKKSLSIIDVGRHTQLLVVAIKARNGDYQYKPGGNTALQEGDVLIVLGTPGELALARGLS
ncbi:NAD-binding protein [Anaerolineales bacterium HSG6]|nr:NAD-binding protein [Anaerolineales bacterium HSG6]MDM8530782.1 NAD-binding protein [Anaerolineales bacterium HSG25]